MEPQGIFLLEKKKAICGSRGHCGDVYYDEKRQLWAIKSTGEPVVNAMNKSRVTSFGETVATESNGEGVDQSELSGPININASSFGETTITESGEGTDQSSSGTFFRVGASSFGETSMTRSSEGTDQPECIDATSFGETSITFTIEGVDQP